MPETASKGMRFSWPVLNTAIQLIAIWHDEHRPTKYIIRTCGSQVQWSPPRCVLCPCLCLYRLALAQSLLLIRCESRPIYPVVLGSSRRKYGLVVVEPAARYDGPNSEGCDEVVLAQQNACRRSGSRGRIQPARVRKLLPSSVNDTSRHGSGRELAWRRFSGCGVDPASSRTCREGSRRLEEATRSCISGVSFAIGLGLCLPP